MFLFGKKPPKQQQFNGFSYVLAKGFRGFKRFPITIHGNQLAENNNELLKDADLRGHTLAFMPGSSPNYKEPFFIVLVDNLQIGSIFDTEQIQAISSGKIVEVFARPEEENVMNTIRHRIRVFVKYKEG